MQRIQVVSVRLHYFLISLNINLVAIATFLDKLENKVQIHHLYIKIFHMVKRRRKSVQYIGRYSTKYAKTRQHATQFPSVSLFSAETTGPIFTKILHVIVALVALLYLSLIHI